MPSARVPPPEILATWPKPNYINPSNPTARLKGVEITLCAITVIVVILRLYSRIFLTRSYGADDFLMSASLILDIGLTIINCIAPQWGWGVHLYDFNPEWLTPARKLAVAVETVYIPCVALAKLSILVFYYRVFSGSGSSRTFRWLIYGGYIYLIIFTITGLLVIFLQAIPLRAYWDDNVPGKFMNLQAAFTFYGILNCVSDLYVFLLPIRMVWQLQLPKKQRIVLAVSFALGSIVCIAAVIRIYYIYRVYDLNNWDFSYDAGILFQLNVVEGTLGIFCSSLPALKPLVARYAPKLLSTNRENSKPTGYRLSSYNNNTRGNTASPANVHNESEDDIVPLNLQRTVVWSSTSSGNSNNNLSIEKKSEIKVSVADKNSG
ncbi:hypothetical protein Dda_3116 [Drechslerella dactyloides]|uniref:Rhodopsin domain-containing protein n=1 Tax=Drechslerella dactyloides TaxID=74499 RepID=A0AAD6J2B7_DREDA|nr:hypothetical protein Dda_3116 [Drechslerella dactyloides]